MFRECWMSNSCSCSNSKVIAPRTLFLKLSTYTSIYRSEKLLRKQLRKISDGWGIPQLPSDKECGYFVLRFMKEIIEDEGLAFVNKWERRQYNTYTQEDIDEVRAEWENFVGQFM